MTALDAAWREANPLPQPGHDTDKNRRGRVLVAGSSAHVPGAIRLTGEAALRAGAGKIQLASVERAVVALGVAVPEAAVFPLPAGEQGELAPSAGEAICELLDRCDTLVLGPGMGGEGAAEAILRTVLEHPRPELSLLLDAAMIPAAAACIDLLHAWQGRVVLTPHPGEMAGLMACDHGRVVKDPERIATEAAERFAATIVLKGAETHIACPGEKLLHYPGGGPGLATAGSGDVLAGVLGGLLARGASPRVAAGWAVWLHGEAGRGLATRIGPLGFLAHELLPMIPGLMAEPSPP